MICMCDDGLADYLWLGQSVRDLLRELIVKLVGRPDDGLAEPGLGVVNLITTSHCKHKSLSNKHRRQVDCVARRHPGRENGWKWVEMGENG